MSLPFMPSLDFSLFSMPFSYSSVIGAINAKLVNLPFDPIFITYFGLGLLALIPIYYGSKLSIKDDKEETEQVSQSDAYWFPIIGSAVLFTFYVLFKYFPKEYINYALTAYFAALGIVSLIKLSVLMARCVIPSRLELFKSFHLTLTHRESLNKPEASVINIKITWLNTLLSILSILFTGYYVWSKNWIASNIFGLAFSTSAIGLMQLDSFFTGMTLLAGLFVYDIFWVFGTNVMVKVATSFDVPVKMLFPRNILLKPMSEFSMLGLGDIVIPGVYVAFSLKFDEYLKSKGLTTCRCYFWTSFLFYIGGLTTTMAVMHTVKKAQPALLYLSPACILSTLLVGLIKGQFREIFSFTTEPPKAPPVSFSELVDIPISSKSGASRNKNSKESDYESSVEREKEKRNFSQERIEGDKKKSNNEIKNISKGESKKNVNSNDQDASFSPSHSSKKKTDGGASKKSGKRD